MLCQVASGAREEQLAAGTAAAREKAAAEAAMQEQLAALKAQIDSLKGQAEQAQAKVVEETERAAKEKAKAMERQRAVADAQQQLVAEHSSMEQLREELERLGAANKLAGDQSQSRDLQTIDELRAELESRQQENDKLKGQEYQKVALDDQSQAELEAALAALKNENRSLRQKGNQPPSKDDDEIYFEEYLGQLKGILAMREAGTTNTDAFDKYNEALVHLSDDCLKEMYINFMLIYTGAYTDEVLERCGISAPPGFAYQGHSIRSGGVSAQAAIGVERHLYVWLGGWARGSATVDKHYIDPTVLPTAAAYELYGWALARQFSADAGVVVAATTLPDPLDGDVSSDDSDEAERPPPLPLPRAAAASAARVHPPLPRRQRARGARAPAPDSSADSEEVPYSQRWAARWLGTARA